MDEEELEAWYDEQSEKLLDEYRSTINTNPVRSKKTYMDKMKKLHQRYESMSEKTVKKNLENHFRNHRIQMLKSRLLGPFYRLRERLRRE